LSPHGHNHIRRLVDNALDLCRQRLEGVLFLGMIGIAVIYAADAAEFVGQAAFRCVGRDPGAREQRPGRAP
jgi:hypothetical protein